MLGKHHKNPHNLFNTCQFFEMLIIIPRNIDLYPLIDWQFAIENDHLWLIYPLKTVISHISHGYVSLPEGIYDDLRSWNYGILYGCLWHFLITIPNIYGLWHVWSFTSTLHVRHWQSHWQDLRNCHLWSFFFREMQKMIQREV